MRESHLPAGPLGYANDVYSDSTTRGSERPGRGATGISANHRLKSSLVIIPPPAFPRLLHNDPLTQQGPSVEVADGVLGILTSDRNDVGDLPLGYRIPQIHKPP